MTSMKEAYKLRSRVIEIAASPEGPQENPRRPVVVRPRRIFPPGFKRVSFGDGDWMWISPILQVVKNANEKNMAFPGTEGDRSPDNKTVGARIVTVSILGKHKCWIGVKLGYRLNLQSSRPGSYQPLTPEAWLDIDPGSYFEFTPNGAHVVPAVPGGSNVLICMKIRGVEGQLLYYRADATEVIEYPVLHESVNQSEQEVEDLPLHPLVEDAANASSEQNVTGGLPSEAQSNDDDDSSLSTEYLSALSSGFNCEQIMHQTNDEQEGSNDHVSVKTENTDMDREPETMDTTNDEENDSDDHIENGSSNIDCGREILNETDYQHSNSDNSSIPSYDSIPIGTTARRPLVDLELIPRCLFGKDSSLSASTAKSQSHSFTGEMSDPCSFKESLSNLSRRCSFVASQEQANSRESNLSELCGRKPPRAQPPSPSGKWRSRTQRHTIQQRINKKFKKALKASLSCASGLRFSFASHGEESQSSSSRETTAVGVIAAQPSSRPRVWNSKNHKHNARRRSKKRQAKALAESKEQLPTGEAHHGEGQFDVFSVENNHKQFSNNVQISAIIADSPLIEENIIRNRQSVCLERGRGPHNIPASDDANKEYLRLQNQRHSILCVLNSIIFIFLFILYIFFQYLLIF